MDGISLKGEDYSSGCRSVRKNLAKAKGIGAALDGGKTVTELSPIAKFGGSRNKGDHLLDILTLKICPGEINKGDNISRIPGPLISPVSKVLCNGHPLKHN